MVLLVGGGVILHHDTLYYDPLYVCDIMWASTKIIITKLY